MKKGKQEKRNSEQMLGSKEIMHEPTNMFRVEGKYCSHEIRAGSYKRDIQRMRNDFCKLKLRDQKGKTSTEELEDKIKENFQKFSRQNKKEKTGT